MEKELIITGYGPFENSIGGLWAVASLGDTQLGLQEGLQAVCPFTFRAASYFLYVAAPFITKPDLPDLMVAVAERLRGIAEGEEACIDEWIDEEFAAEAILTQARELLALKDRIALGEPLPSPIHRNVQERIVVKAITKGFTPTEAL